MRAKRTYRYTYETSTTHASSARDEAVFHETLRSQLSAALPSGSTDTAGRDVNAGADVPSTSSKYLVAASRLLQQSQALIKEYDTMARSILNTTLSESLVVLEQGWQRDQEKVAQLLATGRNIAEKEAAKVIQAQENNKQEEKLGSKDGEVLREASVYFSKQKVQDSRLGDALRGAERGVRRIARELPREED